jgi:hypothetical protein
MASPRRSFPALSNRPSWPSQNGASVLVSPLSSISQIFSDGRQRISEAGRLASIGMPSSRQSASLPTVPKLPAPRPGMRSCGSSVRSTLRDGVVMDATSFCTEQFQEGSSKSAVSCTSGWTYGATCHLQAMKAATSQSAAAQGKTTQRLVVSSAILLRKISIILPLGRVPARSSHTVPAFFGP